MLQKINAILLLITLLFMSCANGHKPAAGIASSAVTEQVTTRDRTIDTTNSFNDIFLDSIAMERFIVSEKLNDTIANAIRSFYNTRNYEYAWFSSTGLIEQSFSFRSLYTTQNDTDAFNKGLEHRLDALRAQEGDKTPTGPRDPTTIKTELQITERFIRYAMKTYAGMGISPTALGTYIPSKKHTIMTVADSVLANTTINNNYAAVNEQYRLLKEQLRKYYDIEKKGGWPVLVSLSGKYDSGYSDPAIAEIKKRLQVTGELKGNDTTELFTVELKHAVENYQLAHGFKATGKVNIALLKDLNITAKARIQQLLINIQRMRWMPTQPAGALIIVNIPEFVVYMDSGKHTVFQMDVVVGREGHNTTLFSGNVSFVVFSPYWNVPPSIVKKEMLSGMRRDRNYLKKRNMEITSRSGGLPTIRQRPGARNALGRVKFLFPNTFNIYMHDTPEKGFFDRSQRGLSHGCIRLSDAPKMAYYLLRNDDDWPQDKIDIAMNGGKEQYVKLKEPVPVIITYYTAWEDNTGHLHFADDIYGHDKKMAAKMFVDPE